jgi:hypothetical protein
MANRYSAIEEIAAMIARNAVMSQNNVTQFAVNNDETNFSLHFQPIAKAAILTWVSFQTTSLKKDWLHDMCLDINPHKQKIFSFCMNVCKNCHQDILKESTKITTPQ